MKIFEIVILTATAAVIVSCAKPAPNKVETESAQLNAPETMEGKSNDEQQVVNPVSATQEREITRKMNNFESSSPVIMWTTQTDLPIYNAEKEMVGSSKNKNFVRIYALEDGKAFLSKDKETWMSDRFLTIERPKLIRGMDNITTGLERVDKDALREKLMKAKAKRDGN